MQHQKFSAGAAAAAAAEAEAKHAAMFPYRNYFLLLVCCNEMSVPLQKRKLTP